MNANIYNVISLKYILPVIIITFSPCLPRVSMLPVQPGNHHNLLPHAFPLSCLHFRPLVFLPWFRWNPRWLLKVLLMISSPKNHVGTWLSTALFNIPMHPVGTFGIRVPLLPICNLCVILLIDFVQSVSGYGLPCPFVFCPTWQSIGFSFKKLFDDPVCPTVIRPFACVLFIAQ